MNLESIRSKCSFSFLGNPELEEELYLSENYRQFLQKTLGSNEKHLSDNIKFSLSHSIVICYGGILEALLHEYVFQYFTRTGDDTKIKKFCKVVEYKEKSELLAKKTNPELGFVYCERFIRYEKFRENINFNLLILGCSDQKLLSKTTIEKLHKIRKIRNGIHISAIMDAKDIFSYRDLYKITQDVKCIFGEIRKKHEKFHT